MPHLFVSALVNAEPVAVAVSQLLDATDLAATVIACGERRRQSGGDGEMRVAVEDYLGAGAILSYLTHAKSPEARVCEGAFLQARSDLEEIVRECGSGRELRKAGFDADVKHAARLNLYDSVPVMRGERLEKLA